MKDTGYICTAYLKSKMSKNKEETPSLNIEISEDSRKRFKLYFQYLLEKNIADMRKNTEAVRVKIKRILNFHCKRAGGEDFYDKAATDIIDLIFGITPTDVEDFLQREGEKK